MLFPTSKTVLPCLVFACISISSCRSPERGASVEDGRVKKVDVTNLHDISIFDIFSRVELVPLETNDAIPGHLPYWALGVELVPLETNDSSNIVEANKVLLHEGHFYVLDIKSSAVLVFTEDGKFIRKIQNLGRGPGEYTALSDFVINRYTGNLELLTPPGQVLTYAKDGTFISAFQLPDPLRAADYIAVLDSGKRAIYSVPSQKRLYFYDMNTGTYDDITQEVPDFVFRKTPLNPKHSVFFEYGGEQYFSEMHANTVHRIEVGKLQPVFEWDFGKYNIEVDELPKDKSMDFYIEYIPNNLAGAFMYHAQDNRHLMTSIMFKKKWHMLVYDKEKRDYRFFASTVEGLKPLSMQFFDGGAFSYALPQLIKLLANEKVLDEQHRDIFKKISIEDNPIIVKYLY